MANLSVVIKALREERERATKQIQQIDAALAALGSSSSRGRGHRKGHTMSVAARRKIAVAQRARWARMKARKNAA